MSSQPAEEDSEGTKSEEKDKEEEESSQSLAENWRRFRRLTPYLWPSKSRILQLYVVSAELLDQIRINLLILPSPDQLERSSASCSCS